MLRFAGRLRARGANARGRRLVPLAVLTTSLLALAATPALASSAPAGASASGTGFKVRIDHRAYGVVPSALAEGHRTGRPTKAGFATGAASTNNLNYNGGPVMHTNTVYAIYWQPSGYAPSTANPVMSTTYAPLINRFFGDVAAAQNAADNVYATDTQYYSGSAASPSYITNSSSFGGYAVATDPLPADQCSQYYSGSGFSPSGCVTDAQVQAEVSNVIAKNGWTASPTTEFFLFTPKNLGSCVPGFFTMDCAYSYYCAYHSNYTNSSVGGEVLYANMPYSDTSAIGNAAACGSGQSPNGDPAADSTINVMSHEHNETITDPLGNAWYDSSGNENGDKCAWNFGTASGSSGAEYNQTINGHNYYVQQEWSNASSGCALSYAPPAPTAPSSPSGLSAKAGNAQVSLTWSASTGTAPITYSVYRSTSANMSGSTMVASNLSSPSYTDTGLSNGTAYFYDVVATNRAGSSGASNVASATPNAMTLPGPPTNLTAKTSSSRGVALSWAAPANNGGSTITSYQLYRSRTSGGETALVKVTCSATTCSYNDSNTSSGRRYYYKVAAINSVGTGQQSNEAYATAR